MDFVRLSPVSDQIWRGFADRGIQLEELLIESYLLSLQTFEHQKVFQLQKLMSDNLLDLSMHMSCLEAVFRLGNLFHL